MRLGVRFKAHGTWPLDHAVVRYAEHGFPVAPRVASDWKGFVAKLGNSAGATWHQSCSTDRRRPTSSSCPHWPKR